MLYLNAEILAVSADKVTVHNPDLNSNINVYLPSVISRLPVVGDHIIYDKDDVDGLYGVFVNYQGETPITFTAHQHQLLSDDVIANMALDASQKADIRQKTTGGIK